MTAPKPSADAMTPYQLPFPKNGNRFTYVLKDWQISGTTTFRDGLAAPVLTADGGSGTDNFHERPDCVGPIRYQLKDFSQPYVLPGAFAPEAPGTFGNCPRNPIVAPGLTNWDFAIQRTFKFGERFSFEFRTSFFNAFNHPNFAEPSPDLSTRITATADDGSTQNVSKPSSIRRLKPPLTSAAERNQGRSQLSFRSTNSRYIWWR